MDIPFGGFLPFLHPSEEGNEFSRGTREKVVLRPYGSSFWRKGRKRRNFFGRPVRICCRVEHVHFGPLEAFPTPLRHDGARIVSTTSYFRMIRSSLQYVAVARWGAPEGGFFSAQRITSLPDIARQDRRTDAFATSPTSMLAREMGGRRGIDGHRPIARPCTTNDAQV